MAVGNGSISVHKHLHTLILSQVKSGVLINAFRFTRRKIVHINLQCLLV